MVFFVLNIKTNLKKTFYKIKFKNFIKFRRKSKVVHPQYFEAYSAGGTTEKTTYKSVKDMPGPQPDLPLFGTSWVFSSFGPYSKDQVLTTVREDFLSKYGPIYRENMGGVSIVSLHEPNHVELVLRSQGMNPMRVVNEANIYFRKSRPDLYQSIGLVDSIGEDWRSIRLKTSPPLLNPKLLTPYAEVFSNLTDEFLQVLKSEVNPSVGEASGSRSVDEALESRGVGRTLNIRPFLFRFALEAIWKISLGVDLGALKPNPTEEVSNIILQSVTQFDALATLNTSRPWWKLCPAAVRLCPFSSFSKFCSSEETIFRIVSEHTQRVMKEIREECDSETVGKPSILRHYLNVDQLSSKDINTVIVDFIVAGISTTSYFLCLLLHRLGQENEVQARLQEELDQVLGRTDVVITEERLRSLVYLKAVLKEGFRLTSIIPGILKILPVDIACDQYLIPAHTPIMCQMRAASKSPKYFSHPENFIPERFLKNADSAEMKQLQKEVYDNRFILLPFGFGPRVCIGKRLAEKEMLVFLAKILLNFSIRSHGNLELSNSFIIGPKSSVPLEFIARS